MWVQRTTPRTNIESGGAACKNRHPARHRNDLGNVVYQCNQYGPTILKDDQRSPCLPIHAGSLTILPLPFTLNWTIMPFTYQTLCYDDAPRPGRQMDVFAPQQPSHNLAFFFVHGGGWRAGTRTIFHNIMHHLTTLGYACASADYRLKGQDAIGQLGDVRLGHHLFCQWLAQRHLPERTLVVGSSAGAHLAALLALARPGELGEPLPAEDIASPAPLALAVQAMPVTFEPWEDIFPAIWSAMQDIAGQPYQPGSPRYKALSPIEHLKKESPAILLMDAGNEHMFPRELSDVFVAKARALGVPITQELYPRVEHGFFYDLTRPMQQKAMADILALASSVE